jgi:hypothetical protein
LSAEVSAPPELYYNIKNGASVAGKGLVDMDKTAPVIEVETTIDPTGIDKRTAAFKVPVRVGEIVEEYKDPTTGLPIKRTKLASENVTVGKQQFAAIPEDQYQKLIADKSISNHVRMIAIAKMREANKVAFEKAGIKDGHLAVSKNNSASFVGKVDGYIDPFSESNIYMFERIAARDFLANSRGYDSNGYSIGMDIKTSQDRTKPSQTTVINQTGTQTPIVDLWADINFGPGKTITSNGKNIGIAMTGLNSETQAIIRTSINKGRKEENFITDDQMIIVPASDGRKLVYRWDPEKNKIVGDKPISTLSEQTFNPKAQPTAKGKVESIKQAQGKQGKVMTAAEWKALPLAERLEKQKEGWTFK